MSDRELLELAAKAAGYEWKWDLPRGMKKGGWLRIKVGDRWPVWDPLKDDGEALRLAITLDITIDAPKGGRFVYAGGQGSFSEPVGKDKMAATRRAIVRAAAEIGKGMS